MFSFLKSIIQIFRPAVASVCMFLCINVIGVSAPMDDFSLYTVYIHTSIIDIFFHLLYKKAIRADTGLYCGGGVRNIKWL